MSESIEETFSVANVEDAIELAQRFKDDGRYNWFRGQVRDLPPYSSLVRANRDKVRALRAKVRRVLFTEWVRKTPELSYLLEEENVHDRDAIMQHYGIPTHFIDFTTDPAVAGFFASDTQSAPTEGRSCIYCLDTKDLMRVWDLFKDTDGYKGAAVELVTIDVRNLWRLETQRGRFVYANFNWDILYPLDRIIFPYTRYPGYPTAQRICPKDKSPLEQLLDQYFSLESATFRLEDRKRMIETLRSRGVRAEMLLWETPVGGYYEQAFPEKSRMVALDSWNQGALQGWDADPHEDFFQTAGPGLHLKLDPAATPEEVRKTVSLSVRQILRSEPNVRLRAVDWVFTGLSGKASSQELNDAIRPPWNGMRRLPYSDASIGDALASIVALMVADPGRPITASTAKHNTVHLRIFIARFKSIAGKGREWRGRRG